MVGGAIDAGAEDWEGEEGEGLALGEQGWAEADDWVSVILEMPYHEGAPCKYSQRYSRF